MDTRAPQYGITIDSISEDTGQSGSDFITMDTSLTINGSLGSALASDERVQISLDGGNTGLTLPSLTSAGAIRTPAIWRTGITTTGADHRPGGQRRLNHFAGGNG